MYSTPTHKGSYVGGAGQQSRAGYPPSAHQQQQMAAYRAAQQQAAGGGYPQQHHAQQQQRSLQAQQGAGAKSTVTQGSVSNDVTAMSDGNEGLRNAKRRRPTDRSLPSFREPVSASLSSGLTATKLSRSTAHLQAMAESYKELQAVERKLDWNVLRRKVELGESLAGNRSAGMKRTLRLRVQTVLKDQAWQLPLGDLTAPFPSDKPPSPPPTKESPSSIPHTTVENVAAASSGVASTAHSPTLVHPVPPDSKSVDDTTRADNSSIGGSTAPGSGLTGDIIHSTDQLKAPELPAASALSTEAPDANSLSTSSFEDPTQLVAATEADQGIGIPLLAPSDDIPARSNSNVEVAGSEPALVSPHFVADVQTNLTPNSVRETTPPIIGAPNFSKGTGIPRIELGISGELIGLPQDDKQPFSSYVKRVVVETDRDPALYDKTGPVDWRRPTGAPSNAVPGLMLSLPTSVPTQFRISVYLDHRPDQVALIPDLAAMLDMRKGDRASILQALWSYIKLNGLQDEDKRHIRPDARMKRLFSGQEKVPFHHLPEYVNRFLGPPQPVVIEHMVRVGESAGAYISTAFDLEIVLEDPARIEMEKVAETLNTVNERLEEVINLDQKIAYSASLCKAAHLKRSFLSAFASSPVAFLDRWVTSQSQDLNMLLSGDRGSQAAVGGNADWREEIRRAQAWQGSWVKEGASVWGNREQELLLKHSAPIPIGKGVATNRQTTPNTPLKR